MIIILTGNIIQCTLNFENMYHRGLGYYNIITTIHRCVCITDGDDDVVGARKINCIIVYNNIVRRTIIIVRTHTVHVRPLRDHYNLVPGVRGIHCVRFISFQPGVAFVGFCAILSERK